MTPRDEWPRLNTGSNFEGPIEGKDDVRKKIQTSDFETTSVKQIVKASVKLVSNAQDSVFEC